MIIVSVLLAWGLGLLCATAAGALSGVRVGADALGRELASFMGGIYGLLAGVFAVTIGLALAGLLSYAWQG